jgi:hypothetical protein
MKTFKGYLSEMYSFFPKSVGEIDKSLKSFPAENKSDILNLYTYLKSVDKSIESPINVDMNIPGVVNVARAFSGVTDIETIKKGAKLKKIKIKFGNGSSGNRGANNRGNLFEPQFAAALLDWWAGNPVNDNDMLAAIKDLDKTYKLSKAKTFKVDVVGGENTKRPLTFGKDITLANPKGTGYDVGKSVTDITLTKNKEEIYLSLKLGSTTTFFNVGVRTILSPADIKTGSISNKDGLKLLGMFGIDPVKFCAVFNGKSKGSIDKSAPYNKTAISKLLQSGIGYNYHVIHKMGKKILSKEMSEEAMKKAAKITSPITIYYGGKGGNGKRIDIEFESASYKFKLNIRDTQGTDGYPTRLMCDFTHK